MGKLFKYELRRSRLIFIGIAAITLFMEILYLIGYCFDIGVLFGIGLGGGILLICLSTTAILLYGVVMFNDDISKKPGYLLLSTPRSTAQIIGAKLLMTLFALLGTAILFLVLITFDVWLALRDAELSFLSLLSMMDASLTKDAVLETIFNGRNFFGLCMYIFTSIISFVANVIVAYIVIVMTKTIFHMQKGRAILGIILWFFITNAISMISGYISQGILHLEDSEPAAEDTISILDFLFDTLFSPAMYLPTLLLSAACCVGGFFLTRWMMDKKLSV